MDGGAFQSGFVCGKRLAPGWGACHGIMARAMVLAVLIAPPQEPGPGIPRFLPLLELVGGDRFLDATGFDKE